MKTKSSHKLTLKTTWNQILGIRKWSRSRRPETLL